MREIVVPPPVTASMPPQVFEVTSGFVIRNPGAGVSGKMSMKLRPVMGTVAVFVIVKTTATTLPFVVELGTNSLVNVGAAKGPGGKPIMLNARRGIGSGQGRDRRRRHRRGHKRAGLTWGNRSNRRSGWQPYPRSSGFCIWVLHRDDWPWQRADWIPLFSLLTSC